MADQIWVPEETERDDAPLDTEVPCVGGVCLFTLAHELLMAPDVGLGLNALLHKLREAYGGSRAFLYELDFRTQTASNTYEACGENVPPRQETLQSIPLTAMNFWLTAFAQKGGSYLTDADALREGWREERKLLREKGVRSVLAVPVLRDGTLVAILGIDDPTQSVPRIHRLAALGDPVAVALARRDAPALPAEEDLPRRYHAPSGHAALRQVTETPFWYPRFLTPSVLILSTLAFCFLIFGLLLFASPGRAGSHMDSFSETVLPLQEGWVITDSAGVSQPVTFPLTIEYGTDGQYTLSCTLPQPEDMIASPVLCFYSNYIDLTVSLDGETLLRWPDSAEPSRGPTGNTYHLLRIASDYAGRALSISLQCQLGDDITYLLKAPLLGSKGTILHAAVMESLPFILLAGCLMVLGMVLGVLHLLLRKRLHLTNATAYTALFAGVFAAYVFCETRFAQLLSGNPYALFSGTLMLLALVPVPLVGLFADEVSRRFRAVPVCLMALCSVGFLGQTVLHYAGVTCLRVTLPVTHVLIILSISVMAFCLLCSDRQEKPDARRKLLTALPMVTGGTVDILLIILRRPSLNNSFYFTLGVTVFIVVQFYVFFKDFFRLYRTSLETRLWRDMAYRDSLTSIGNRNAYERKLKELSGSGLSARLCCIVIDINDLKQINDRYGHAVGDAAIVEASRILQELMPRQAACFRTGGDEFVALLEGLESAQAQALSARIAAEARRRGKRYKIPLTLAIGCGNFEPQDGNLLDFIRRVDALMYEHKRRYKSSPEYLFASAETASRGTADR